MLSEDFAFRGYTAETWGAILALLGQRAPGRTRPTLIVIESAERRPLAAFTSVGQIVDVAEYGGRDALPALCEQLRCRGAVVVQEGTIERVGRKTAAKTARGTDLLEQVLPVLAALREAELRGEIFRYPAPTLVPLPTVNVVRRAVDMVLPDGRALVLCVWQGHALWTGMVLRRSGGLIDLCAGPDAIAEWVGPLGGDYHRDHRAITHAVTRAVAPVHLGLYAQREQLQALLRNAEPGAWLKAFALREVVFDPAPPYVGAALGADAARVTARRIRALLGGIDLLGQLQPYASAARAQFGPMSSVTRMLGFNPLHHLAQRLTEQDDRTDS